MLVVNHAFMCITDCVSSRWSTWEIVELNQPDISSRLSDLHSYSTAGVTPEVRGLRWAVRLLPLFVRWALDELAPNSDKANKPLLSGKASIRDKICVVTELLPRYQLKMAWHKAPVDLERSVWHTVQYADCYNTIRAHFTLVGMKWVKQWFSILSALALSVEMQVKDTILSISDAFFSDANAYATCSNVSMHEKKLSVKYGG